MMFAREGYPLMLGAALLAAIAFVAALKFRSWPLWLAALGITVIALSLAWFFRESNAGQAVVAELLVS